MIFILCSEKYNKILELALSSLLLELDYDESQIEVEIVFLSKLDMKKINKRSRGIDEATDVLSFPYINWANFDKDNIGLESINPENGALLLGEIYICEEIAIAQANEFGHSIEREIAFLAIHGMLHLFGYDHLEEQEKETMFALQEKILKKIGVPNGL